MEKYILPDNLDLDNAEFRTLWQLINETNQSIFLTGKAGTGKSTFLKYICNNTHKKFVVLSPTGIAAVNVGGMTMHSFFKIPFKPILPDDPDFRPLNIRKTLKYSRDKIKLLKQLDLIIIDEISMVRADIIDFMDKVLRVFCENMREPFGGKQLLLVGDIFQLEPVVTADMRDVLRRFYRNFFFFNAFAFSSINLVPIELRKIYRQNNPQFISLLDRVRDNRVNDSDLQLINSRFVYNYQPNHNDFIITLATRRDAVDAINQQCLDALLTEEHNYLGSIDGDFPEQSLPTSLQLTLKEGAQVIFIRNDKEQRWVNGTIGIVKKLDDDSILVELEDGNSYTVEREQWENIRYTYNDKKKVIEEQMLGVFQQYPLKPAWALTVHKSQGLTFNKVVIDFSNGAFAGGQTYVALSRCTSLEGITLTHPISHRDIIVNPEIVKFSNSFNNSAIINDALLRAKANALYQQASVAFDKMDFAQAVNLFADASKLCSVADNVAVRRLICRKLNRFNALNDTISVLKDTIYKQNCRFRELANEYAQLGRESLAMSGNLVEDSTVAYGPAHHDSVSIKASIANYNKALSLYPECTAALNGKAEVMMMLGDDDEAMNLLEQSLTIEPFNPTTLAIVARHLVAAEQYVEAIKVLKKMVKSDSLNPWPLEQLADCYDAIDMDDFADKFRAKAQRLRRKKG